MMKPFTYLLLSACLLLFCSAREKSRRLPLLPQPQKIVIDPSGKHRLRKGEPDPRVVTEIIVASVAEAEVNQDEAYRLRITRDSIRMEATTDEGIYRARQTLSQLIASSDNKSLPVLEITDWPAFRVRGFLHDVGRGFIPVEELKKQITLLAKFKINVFHWHLTENQGWRLESKRYPELNDSSSFARLPGKYYTLSDAHAIAAHCKANHMLLIPEIDMPGHSEAFVRATGHDMQSAEGMKILKDLMEEICTEVFPDAPWIHIGTDEVQFTNPSFVPEMVAHIRGLGKRVISWNPGWKYAPGEIDATQLWSYRGQAQPGIPAIDSRFHYINHFDAFGDIVALYNSRIYNCEKGSDDIAGAILAVWNDRMLEDEKQIIRQNYLYPNMLALAERAWLGGGSEYFDKNGVILPTDEADPVFRSFADFEQRMLWHKAHTFSGIDFPYVKQTDIRWTLSDPFPNGGDLSALFPPEEQLNNRYTYNGQTYETHPAIGAGIYLRHVWGTIVPAFFDDPKENHTAYAWTYVWSAKKQTVGLWATTQDYSRSEADLPPPQGEWDFRKSRIFINDQPLSPPRWENSHTQKSNEISLKNENFAGREPIPVRLKKGWNKVLLKLPVGRFSTPEVRLQKWMFTFVFVTPDGKERAEGLIYSPEKRRDKRMEMVWTGLSTDGIEGNLAKGVSAAYAALIGEKLLVAGGANFAGKPGFEGGLKSFYDEIQLFDTHRNRWKVVGHLPTPAAYGISLQTPEGFYWIGGNYASGSLASVYRVSLSENDSVALIPVASLPATMDNFAGCALNNRLFAAGGNVNGKPSNALYTLDTQQESEWRALPDFPGIPRLQPVMAALRQNGKGYLYLLGGFFGGDKERSPAMATDVFRYDVAAKKWEKAGELIDPVTGKPFALGGAAAMPIDNRYILCLGGVNHDIFLEAVATQYRIAHDPLLTDEEKQLRNLEFSKSYMTQPAEAYRFNREWRLFDTKTAEWKTLGSSPEAARAGAVLVGSDTLFYAVQGELKPGVRSPLTFRGRLKRNPQ